MRFCFVVADVCVLLLVFFFVGSWITIISYL
jgi:hypothetical protein